MAEAVTTVEDSLIVAILLLSWLILAVTRHVSPVFRSSFSRYFTAHRFYIEDVQHHHIRTLLPGSSILLQHLLLTGIVFYCLGSTLFSPAEIDALFSRYPALPIFGENSFSFFNWGVITAFLVETVSVIWLLLATPLRKHLNQVFNLYPWPLQLNLLFSTVIVTVFVSGYNNTLLYIFAAIFFLIFLLTFIIASIDTVTFAQNSKQRVRIFSCTTALYILVLIGLAVWISLSPQLLNVI